MEDFQTANIEGEALRTPGHSQYQSFLYDMTYGNVEGVDIVTLPNHFFDMRQAGSTMSR